MYYQFLSFMKKSGKYIRLSLKNSTNKKWRTKEEKNKLPYNNNKPLYGFPSETKDLNNAIICDNIRSMYININMYPYSCIS